MQYLTWNMKEDQMPFILIWSCITINKYVLIYIQYRTFEVIVIVYNITLNTHNF